MGRLAHCRVIHVEIAADGTHHDCPGIQTDADLHGHAMAALHLGGVLFHRGLHRQRRIAGPHRVIFMRQRRPKEGHNAIAHHLVHRAFVPMHGSHHAFQHGIKELPRLLRVAIGEEFHGTFEVGNSTVTCLRSPSSALREVRICSARCGGV